MASGGTTRTNAGTKGNPKKRAMQVNVVVRVRPTLPHERLQPVALRVTKSGQHTKGKGSLLTIAPPNGDTADASEFLFEKCYDDATPQRLLFQREIQPAIGKVLEGINTTVFAYGATGTGKTFTMEGSKRNLGMIPRAVKRMFEVVEEQERDAGFHLDMSYLEIYNDRVLDLLVAKSQQNDLPIRQQTDGTIAVQGLTRKRIATVAAFEDLYEKGSASRARAPTEMNPESSRSHSILMIHARTNDAKGNEIRFGKLHLIDLAGSEDNRKTGNSGARLAESGKINMSLFVLGKVITALNSGDLQRIPFRDSKLTRLLQDSLGGSSHAVMICNVAQTASLYQECLQTLNYAYKAKGIVNQVVVNAPVITKPTAKKYVTTDEKKTVKATKPSPAATSSASSSRLPKATSLAVVAKSPLARATPSSLSLDAMEAKLSKWKQSRSSLTPTTIGMKRPSPTTTTASASLSSTSVPATARVATSTAATSMRSVSSRLSVTATSVARSRLVAATGCVPVPKKPRLSILPTTSTTSGRSSSSLPMATTTGSITKDRKSICPNPAIKKKAVASPASGKENTHTGSSAVNTKPDPAALAQDLTPVELAKKLIGVAIDLEHKKHFSAAYSVFKRAYHVLPETNPKLLERLHALETQCPSAPASVPSQQMSTTAYMQQVLEGSLLDVLNRGTQSELTTLHSIGDKRAEKIIETRPFTQLSDLLQVPGITEKVLQKLHTHHIQW